MVKYNPKTWISLIFHPYSRHTLRILFPALLFIGAYTSIAVYLIIDFFELKFQSTTAVHSLLGIVLGLFLVFRTNSAYDRWWEGRKMWGLLVNNTRNLSLKLAAFLDEKDRDSRLFFAQMIPNFVIALKEHLRHGTKIEELDVTGDGFLERLQGIKHIPNIISLMLYEKVNSLYKERDLSEEQFFVIDKELKNFSDIMGACERIRNTPIPFSYSLYIKKFIFTYTLTLPYAFIDHFYYWTVPMVLMIFYMLVSIELIAEEIEDPFGRDINDLPTEELSKKIKANVREILI